TRNEIATDRDSINQHRDDANVAKLAVAEKTAQVRADTDAAKVENKTAELNAIKASIDEATATIMTIGKMAVTACTGLIAMGDGGGGMDMNKLVAGPTVEPGAPPPTPTPDPMKFHEIDPDAKSATPPPAPTPDYTLPSTTVQT